MELIIGADVRGCAPLRGGVLRTAGPAARASGVLAGAEWPLVAATGPARVIVASCHSTPEVNGCAVSLRLR